MKLPPGYPQQLRNLAKLLPRYPRQLRNLAKLLPVGVRQFHYAVKVHFDTVGGFLRVFKSIRKHTEQLCTYSKNLFQQ